MGVKNDLIDITDEKTNGIIYETFDTPASLFFAKTPVHSAEHKGSYRIFTDLIFANAVQYRKNRETLVYHKSPYILYCTLYCMSKMYMCNSQLRLFLSYGECPVPRCPDKRSLSVH